MTEELIKAANIQKTHILDHIINSEEGYQSFID